jgi:hypothetical protein
LNLSTSSIFKKISKDNFETKFFFKKKTKKRRRNQFWVKKKEKEKKPCYSEYPTRFRVL